MIRRPLSQPLGTGVWARDPGEGHDGAHPLPGGGPAHGPEALKLPAGFQILQRLHTVRPVGWALKPRDRLMEHATLVGGQVFARACLERWCFGDLVATKYAIRSAMTQNAAYQPRGAIVAMMRKACGPFDYSRR